MRRRRGLRTTLLLVAAAGAVALVALAQAGGLLRGLEHETVDARFRLRGPEPAPAGVVVVAIDDRSFDELDQRWPFPRSLHARLIDRLARARVKAIVYDVQFTEETEVEEDNALIEAVAGAPGTVLATTEVDEQGGSKVLGGEETLRAIGARSANSNYVEDSDGVIRRMPLRIDGLASLGVVGAAAATGRPPRLPEGTSTPFIDFRGPPGTLRTVSFSQVVRGRVPARELRGKTVLVGSTAPSLQDVHPTSTARGKPMAGVELQANAVLTAADGFPLRAAPGWTGWLAIVALGSAAPLAVLGAGARRAAVLVSAVAALALLAAWLLFTGGVVAGVVAPLLALVLGAVGALAATGLTSAIDRERTRDLFARFVPERVVDEVLSRTDGDLRLGGVEREGTVLFSDLRGFTAFAEALPVTAVVRVLNRYLTEMSDAILDEGGTLVAYMGDGIMAVFGAPIEQEDHADRALAAARQMLGPRLGAFNAWLREEGLGDGFRMGVGINSGSVMSGNVGSARRLEYTAIGDTTNTAARLEAMTKETRHQLFVADSTRALLRRDAGDLEPLGALEVRGRQGAVEVWTLPGTLVGASPPPRHTQPPTS